MAGFRLNSLVLIDINSSSDLHTKELDASSTESEMKDESNCMYCYDVEKDTPGRLTHFEHIFSITICRNIFSELI